MFSTTRPSPSESRKCCNNIGDACNGDTLKPKRGFASCAHASCATAPKQNATAQIIEKTTLKNLFITYLHAHSAAARATPPFLLHKRQSPAEYSTFFPFLPRIPHHFAPFVPTTLLNRPLSAPTSAFWGYAYCRKRQYGSAVALLATGQYAQLARLFLRNTTRPVRLRQCLFCIHI